MKLLRRQSKRIAAAVWLVVLGAGLLWAHLQGWSVAGILGAIYAHVSGNPYAPLAFIALYLVRPLTFFPAMWLGIAAGSLFGFGIGIVCTILGENLSAATAYALARFFGGHGRDAEAGYEELTPFRRTLQRQAFPTVLVLRAAYLPFDLVNFGCGLLRVPFWPYFFGSVIGLLPPMLTFVSFGASVDFSVFVHHLDDFDEAALFDTHQLLISAALLAGSMVIAWFAHRKRRSKMDR